MDNFYYYDLLVNIQNILKCLIIFLDNQRQNDLFLHNCSTEFLCYVDIQTEYDQFLGNPSTFFHLDHFLGNLLTNAQFPHI